MTTILVANRGEIAQRIFRTAHRMGLGCAAVFSEADARAAFVRAADVSVCIGPAAPSLSYLNIDAIIAAAKEMEATLVHPGYGFLAESAEFAEACAMNGLTFVGPPADVIRAMGSKDEARRIATVAGVPVLPGYADEDQSDETLIKAAQEIGFPIIIKPAEGGGGKGMTVCNSAPEMTQALASARRIAKASFDDDRLILEKYLTLAKHIEVQVLGDNHGNVIHLGERDCSLQRRYQKVLEETPAPNLPAPLRDSLLESAVNLAKSVGYRSAGTCEFIVKFPSDMAFLEMNTRLQVEHPVTEMTTGVDLVEQQIRIAMGEAISTEKVRFRGHAVEVRVYAEDPRQGFLPQAGRLLHLRWPESVRVDSGFEEGDDIPPDYDPLIAKMIAHGSSREQALAKLVEALRSTEIAGVASNVNYLADVAMDPTVRDGLVTSDWTAPAYMARPAEEPATETILSVVGVASAFCERSIPTRDPWASAGPFRLMDAPVVRVPLNCGGEDFVVSVPVERDSFRALDREVNVIDGRHFETGGESYVVVKGDESWFVLARSQHLEIGIGPLPRGAGSTAGHHLDAPMPGQVIAVHVAAGDRIEAGQTLIVIEAMKMEHTLRAPTAGVIAAIHCNVGERVPRGKPLIDLADA